MLQFLSPTALWTLAALSLPLAIHLWRKPPRTVPWGSLRFLENLPRRLHDLRWRERSLLAARLALLALLALLLAGPRWQRRPPRNPQHWLLFDPTATPAGPSLARLRAEQSSGSEIHFLAPGFPPSAPATATPASPDLWSLLREADAELPPGSSLTVFSPGRLASLRGSRPVLTHCRVDWVPTPDLPPAPTPNHDRSPSAPPLHALIVSDPDPAADARNFAAALRAAAQFSGRTVNVQTESPNPITGNSPTPDWVFWLSTQPPPSTWTERGANLLSETYAPATPLPASWIVAASPLPGPIRLWQRTAPSSTPTDTVYWTDGFGQPLLTSAREGRGRHWRFSGRFDPAWTDLPLGGAFPSWLRALVFHQNDPIYDRRLADPSQCHPSDAPSAGPGVTLPWAGEHPIDLHSPLWTLAAFFFGLERLWSHRRRPSDPPR